MIEAKLFDRALVESAAPLPRAELIDLGSGKRHQNVEAIEANARCDLHFDGATICAYRMACSVLTVAAFLQARLWFSVRRTRVKFITFISFYCVSIFRLTV